MYSSVIVLYHGLKKEKLARSHSLLKQFILLLKISQ